MKQYGTGSAIQQGIQAATAAVQGLAGGDVAKAIAGGSAPYLATVIHKMTTDPVTGEVNKTANLMAHAAVNAALAVMQGKNALSGAAGAVTAETVGMIALEVYGKKAGELSESEKQTVSALATLAAGLAGGLAGNSTADVVAGAQAGKTTVENNSMSGLVPPRVQQDASLAFDPSQQGKSTEEISDAINASHIGPSWGTEYKVHPVAQAGGDVSLIRGFTLNGTMDDNHISINQGKIYSIGAHGGASVGVAFGPYMPGIIGKPENDYSFNVGLGLGSLSFSAGKDGIGFSFGAGPNLGWSATEIKGVDVNGTSTKEVYHHDFK